MVLVPWTDELRANKMRKIPPRFSAAGGFMTGVFRPYCGGKLAARYLAMVSNSASVALAPLLAIWLTRSFQPWVSSFCWAAISGEWHWAQTRTVTSRPGPSGKLLKSSASAGALRDANTIAIRNHRTVISPFPAPPDFNLLFRQGEGDHLVIGNHGT